MPTREHLATVGTAHGMALARQLGAELRHARLAAGLSQAAVAAAARLSQGAVSRLEHARTPYPDIVEAARIARMVGLELRIQCFPAAGQLRDAAHIALIRRFLARLPSSVRRQLEAPVRNGDLRAWDLLVQIGPIRIGVIAETRIRDLQLLLRREHRKQLDGSIDFLLLLVADTRHNRSALQEAGPLVTDSFPLGTRTILSQLSRGEPPRENGVVIL